jgi:hypothetical protein
LIGALAIRENVVRITFNQPVKFTEILDPGDASEIERYTITPIAGTKGLDGVSVRSVFPAEVARARIDGAGGKILDVTTDRPFSPYPVRYRIAVNGILSWSGGLLDPMFASRVFDGLHAGFPPKRVDLAHRSRDIANPQNLAAMLDPLPSIDPLILGTIPVDSQGDYAFDEGIDSYRKRVFRRLLTRKGQFAWIPTYGVGVPEQIKRLARVGTREAIAADAEAQIREEPETLEVRCSFEQSEDTPGVWFLRVWARTKSNETINVAVPFSPTGV